MKQYKAYLSNIEWHGISNHIDNVIKGGVKSHIILNDMIKYEDLPKIKDEVWWYLVDEDLLEKNKEYQENIEYLNYCNEKLNEKIANLKYKIEKLEEINNER